MTNLSAEQMVGSNGQTWLVGMSPMAFEVLAAPCCIALALFAAPRYLKSGITTIPQLIGMRFDRSTKHRAGAGRSDSGCIVLRFAGL